MRQISATVVFALTALAGAGPVQSRGGAVTIKVPQFDAAQQSLGVIAAKFGATIVDRRVDVTEKGRKHGWIRLRIPGKNLDSILVEIRKTGELYGETIATVDHAAEIEELTKRMARLAEHRQRLAGILSSARRLRGSDILYVQERLFRAGVDQDLLGLQREALSRKAEQSTVVLTMFEPLSIAEPPKGAWAKVGVAFENGWKDLARAVLGGVSRAVGWAAWLLVLIPIGLILRGQWRRHGDSIRKLLAPRPLGP